MKEPTGAARRPMRGDRVNQRPGHPSIACRWVCSILVVGPLLYRVSATDGDVYHFFILVVLAPVAGLILFANSLFCLLRSRSWKSASFSLLFILVSTIGFLVARYYLPQFRM